MKLYFDSNDDVFTFVRQGLSVNRYGNEFDSDEDSESERDFIELRSIDIDKEMNDFTIYSNKGWSGVFDIYFSHKTFNEYLSVYIERIREDNYELINTNKYRAYTFEGYIIEETTIAEDIEGFDRFTEYHFIRLNYDEMIKRNTGIRNELVEFVLNPTYIQYKADKYGLTFKEYMSYL